MPKVRRYHCYKLTGMTRANDGTWCVYADADKRYRELETQLEEANARADALSTNLTALWSIAGKALKEQKL